ncbi:MAG: hypothetical protein AB7U73_01800 [Pirellulales bacterium]
MRAIVPRDQVDDENFRAVLARLHRKIPIHAVRTKSKERADIFRSQTITRGATRQAPTDCARKIFLRAESTTFQR